MTDQPRDHGSGGTIGEGIRSGIGILAAFKDALEDTIKEAMERGDLSPERARQAVQDTMSRMQQGFDETRERLDFVPRKEFEAMQSQLADLRERVSALERRSYNVAEDSGIIFDAE